MICVDQVSGKRSAEPLKTLMELRGSKVSLKMTLKNTNVILKNTNVILKNTNVILKNTNVILKNTNMILNVILNTRM